MPGIVIVAVVPETSAVASALTPKSFVVHRAYTCSPPGAAPSVAVTVTGFVPAVALSSDTEDTDTGSFVVAWIV